MSTDVITLVDAQREQFAKVVSVKGIEFERERGFAMQVYDANEYFRKVVAENPQSFANSLVNVAAIGITLNPAAKLAYLVPRKRAICLDLSYMGLMHIAQESGAIQWGQARIVREKDTFELSGLDQQPRHVFKPFDAERGKIVGVYVVVKTDGGDYLTHTMTIGQVYDIRDRSDAWKAFQRDNTKKCPWNTDEEEMIKKTCVKQAAKYWPRRERLDSAVHHLNTDGGEGITLTPNKMGETEFADWTKQIQDADTKDAAKAKWREAAIICKDLGDVDSAEKLKAILIQHGTVLDEAAASAAKEKAAA